MAADLPPHGRGRRQHSNVGGRRVVRTGDVRLQLQVVLFMLRRFGIVEIYFLWTQDLGGPF